MKKDFTHLHLHTQYSLLDGATPIPALIAKAADRGMDAVAITDHGNMFGAKLFYDTAKRKNIKPIIGCEVYVARRGRLEKSDSQKDRGGYHLVLLAKNKTGYNNLVKLVSLGWIEGYYYNPRVDKELLKKYHEGLIASTACLAGEVPRTISNNTLEKAEEVINEYREIFGEDLYLELMDLGIADQVKVNEGLIELSKKTGVKLIATNDVHFLNKEDAKAHDILVCLNTGKDYDDPKRMRYTGNEYMKSSDEMWELFKHVPEALTNTREIADKVEIYDLDRDVLLPAFKLPEGFDNQDDYLRHLTFEGAKERYGELSGEVGERIVGELEIIKNMGFAGYFLIVQDLIDAARDMDVSVGPGRGSAAGSAVAYSIGITDIDPIKYKLLFERFLNPERVTMPDIDIDFDEDGREDVMKWVVGKYGINRVAQIITFGTMAAKMAIRDVARVLQLPLNEADKLAKLIPDGPKVTLEKAYNEVSELKDIRESADEKIVRTLEFAETLEGSVRQSGIHACGVIIGPDDLIEHIPLSVSKDSELMVTQYDGKHIENVGMLKMDFLGLKTLSIIKDAVENIKLSSDIEIDSRNLPLEDPKTFELYQKGETVGTFQFESEGMRMHLKDLKPTNIEDLIAMNALYRPGPMEFIPLFIKRKHGIEKVEYPHPMLEGILKDTYGIMVYQEQIMQTAQIMGGFSLGSADLLRRAMGKKNMDIMEQQKAVFVEGAEKNQVDRKKAEEVFDTMTEFAKYGFNRSHSAAYSVVAFQTAYLKANYPAEYMAAVLSRNLSNIKKITVFMDECKRMGLNVLGPDVNESFKKFTVNKKGDIRFGMAAVKNVGENAVTDIIREREKNGSYTDIYNFVERVNLHSVNKKNIENLAFAGGFDSFKDIQRPQFFRETGKEETFIESLIRYGNKFQSESDTSQQSLFGENVDVAIVKPAMPECPGWSKIEYLKKEKELIGIYISAHPLDNYKLEIKNYCTPLSELYELKKFTGKEVKLAGIVSKVEHRTTKTGNPFGSITIEDFTDSYKFMFFSKDYISFKSYFTEGYSLFIKAKTQERYKNPGELELKVSAIEMLEDVKDKMINSVALKIKINELTENLIGDITTIAEKSKGNTELKFLIYDPASKIWIQMFSRSHRITISDDLIEFLDRNQNIEYKIF